MSASASPTLASWVVLGVAGALAAVVLGEPALAALGAPFAVAAVAASPWPATRASRVRASVAPERLLEGDRAVVTYDAARRRRRRVARAAPAAAAGAAWPSRAAQARVLRMAPGDHRLVDLPVRADALGRPARGRRARARHRGVGAVWFTGAAPAEAPSASCRASSACARSCRRRARRPRVGPRRSGARGEGLELAEVRPWVPGDHARRLHWRATARRGEPFVAERHPERAADVLIFVDTFADIPPRAHARAR